MALAATFRQEPETVARAKTSIRGHSPLAITLIDALGSSGSKSAHAALGELAHAASLDDKTRQRAVTALARTSSPSSASIEALEALLKDDPFNSSALYGLGTYARHLRDSGDTVEAGRIAKLLQDRLQRAGDVVSRREVTLGAIMNCGCEQLFADVTPFLSDRTDSVRAMAVRALQSMHDPKVDTLIATRMAGDTASEVRIAAMDAARVREPAELSVRALNQVAMSDADPRVRYRGVDLMIEWLPKRADLRATLQKVAAGDPEPQVRTRAQAAL